MDHSFPWFCKTDDGSPAQDTTPLLLYQCQICQGTVSSNLIHEHAKLHQQPESTSSSETDNNVLEPIIKIEEVEEDDDVIFEGQIFGRSLPPKYNDHCPPQFPHHQNFNCPYPRPGPFKGNFQSVGNNCGGSFSCGQAMHHPMQPQHRDPSEDRQHFGYENPHHSIKCNSSSTGHRMDSVKHSHYSGISSVKPKYTRVVRPKGKCKEYQYEDESEYTVEPAEDNTPLIQRVWSKPTSHMCDLCGKTFKTTVDLVLHANRYHKIKSNFRCEVCFVEYKTKNGLSRHVTRIHKRDK